jgi:hypothetical protein
MIVLSDRMGESLGRWPGWWEGGVARAFEARAAAADGTSDQVIGAAPRLRASKRTAS